MKTYTVTGLWIGKWPRVAAVVEGPVKLVDTNGMSGGHVRWTTDVEAKSPAEAEALAVAEMRGE